jgi:type IV pilus assembly protein PilO
MILGVLDDLRERPPLQKLGALIFLVVIVVVLDWQYVYGPRAETLAENRSLLQQREEELKTKREKADARADAEKELKELSAELKRAEARLPDQREIANLLSSIASSARGVGLDITLFRQQDETYADFYAQVPVEMKMRGTYHDVAMFLDRVKRMDRIVNVSDIRLEKPALQGDRMVLDASCTATTFRFLQEAEREALAAEKAKSKDGKDGKDGKATKRPSRRGT